MKDCPSKILEPHLLGEVTSIEDLIGLEPTVDVWTAPWWKVEGISADGMSRTSFPLSDQIGKKYAFDLMDELREKHPECTTWAVIHFEKHVHLFL